MHSPPDDAIDGAETVAFLRRLSSLISVGQNAARLRDAAALIEQLSERAGTAERLLQQQRQTSNTYIELCSAYETVIDGLKSETIALGTRLDQKTQAAATERADFENEVRRLSLRIAQAETERTATAAELEALRAAFAAIGDSSVVVPIVTLHSLRTQFEFLSDEFAKKGDVISRVMSDIGRCAIDQVIADALAESEAANPGVQMLSGLVASS
jgi:chromosome segregation ATPase